MILSGGPYQTNPAMIAKMRDIAAILNRVRKINSEVRWLSDKNFLQDSIEYASPPVRRRPKEREGRADILEPEHSVSPTITGLHETGSRQKHRMRTAGSTGRGGVGGGSPSTSGVGAHRT